jgi:hypothetical protein
MKDGVFGHHKSKTENLKPYSCGKNRPKLIKTRIQTA